MPTLKSFALFSDSIGRRHAHVLQRKISGVAGADTQLAVDGSGGETLHASLNDET